eukprot:m.95233 g.95233  ORF g.95233 m.95233 type:complete len:90 (-) comp12322_c0_seq4:2680-2949(-)
MGASDSDRAIVILHLEICATCFYISRGFGRSMPRSLRRPVAKIVSGAATRDSTASALARAAAMKPPTVVPITAATPLATIFPWPVLSTL